MNTEIVFFHTVIISPVHTVLVLERSFPMAGDILAVYQRIGIDNSSAICIIVHIPP